MMKKLIFIFCFCISLLFTEFTAAQNIDRIAFINSKELLEVVPGKVDASKAINELNQKYKDELLKMQNEYNKKYSDFITYQASMAESIKLRRMQELSELERNIEAFMRVAQEDIQSQEQHLITPLKEKLKTVIEEVGREQGYVCIYDLANPTMVFITPMAIDANPIIKKRLLTKVD